MAYKVANFLFLVLVVTFPIFRPSIFSTASSSIPVSDAIFLCCSFLVFVALILKQTRLVWDRSFGFLGLFAASLVISTIFSETPTRSAIKLAGHFYLIGIAVLAIHFSIEQDFWRKVVRAWLVGLSITIAAVFAGLILFVFGFTDQTSNYFLFHFGTLPAGNYPRVVGLFANANMLATYLAASLPLVLAAAKIGWIRRRFAGFLLFGIAVATVFSISPGIGGVILSGGLWLLFADPKRFSIRNRRFIATATILGAVGFFAIATVSLDSPNSEKEFQVPGTSIVIEPSVRVFTWQSSAETFLQHPIFGKGTGTDTTFVIYDSFAGPRHLLLDAHNMWLSVAAQTGIVGSFAFCLLQIHLLRRTRFRLKPTNNREALWLGISLSFIGGFIYQGLTGSFEDTRHIWLVIGLLCTISRPDSPID